MDTLGQPEIYIYSIRSAVAGDADRLSEIAIISKSYWPYDSEFIEACRGDLRVSSERAAQDGVFVIETNDSVIGFYSFSMSNDGIPEMNNLFVLPESIGKGVGLRLWQHAISYARGRNWKHFEMDADPFAAAKFYFKVGCVKVGETESTVLKGRLLPRLRYVLD